MTIDPTSQPTQTPPVSGGVTPEQSGTEAQQTTIPAQDPAQPQAPAPAQPQAPAQPLFVANTQDELNAKFGATRDEGRLSLAKAMGFESVEQAQAATQQYWQFVQSGELPPQGQAPAQAQAPQNGTGPTTEQTPAQPSTPATPQNPGQPSYEQLMLERTIDSRALALGANPQQVDNIRAIANAQLQSAARDASGNIPQATVDVALQGIITSVPGFSAAPATVGQYSIPAPPAQKTTDQLIAEATAAGDTQKVIALQMSKMAGPAQTF